eukprot:jgi/Bigna1/130584/aug1.11_g5292
MKDNSQNKAVSEEQNDLQRFFMASFNGSISIASTVNLCFFLQSTWASGLQAIFFHSAGSNQEMISRAFGMYRVLKYIELIDTVLIILRKKWRQLSFLHVYHHSSILILAEISVNFAPWMSVAPLAALNSFVHIIMYGYWAFRSYFGAESTPLSVKKLITVVQIIQFVLGFTQCSIGYLHYSFCPYAALYAAFFMLLFSRFYIRAYCKKGHDESDHVDPTLAGKKNN